MSLNKKLRDRRLLLGLSQNSVAEKLNISRQAISQWENGKSYPDIDNLSRLSVIYHISVDELICDDKEESEANNIVPTVGDKKNTPSEIDYILLTISCVLFVIAPIGLFVAPIVIWQNKKSRLLRNFIYIIILIAVLYNLYVGYSTIMNYLNMGNTSYH
ncbi:MAG: helix-turn-helix domain-containing protein [Leuconostoc mesenteroides]